MKLKFNNNWRILSTLSLLMSVYFINFNDNDKNLKLLGNIMITINIFISTFIFLSPFISKTKKDNQS